MKLIRYTAPGRTVTEFGMVVGGYAVPFDVLLAKTGVSSDSLVDAKVYLGGLPDSERVAKELLQWCEHNIDELGDDQRFLLDEVTLKEPVEVAALFDFGLTPRHLGNSLGTMTTYEQQYPETSGLLAAFADSISAGAADSGQAPPGPLPYYKCNMNSIVGQDELVPWPTYTSRLDIEPELAVVYGNADQPVAGYCIFNDVSARDVQAPEVIGGFCLTKDMAGGNQLGPYLVTPDEIGDPFQQSVSVTVNGESRYRGSTSEISHGPEAVFSFLETIAPLRPGTVMGFGTIPDCTGLDLDDFLDPGDLIEIAFEKLGTLRCRFGVPLVSLLPSRWPIRPALKKYHDG